jgi:hypothetical protein
MNIRRWWDEVMIFAPLEPSIVTTELVDDYTKEEGPR